MAMVDDRTTLNDMDVQADIDQWSSPAFDAIQLNDTNAPTRIYREGAGSGAMIIKGGTDSYWYDDMTFDITGGIQGDKLLVMWLWFSGPASTDNMTDILIGMYDATGGQDGAGNGGRWHYKPIIEAQNTWGWIPAIAYPTQPDETTGTFTSMVKTSMDSIELDVNNGTNDVKLAGIEACFTISYVGGHSQTTTFTNLAVHSADKTNDRDFGVFFQLGDAYRTRVAIRYNDAAATADTVVSESAKVLHFDNFNTDHEIGFHFINDATYTTDFTLSGCFLFWNSGASDVFTGVSTASSLSTWSVTGTTFLRSGPIELPAHATDYVTNANVFNTCGAVDIGSGTFENNTVSGAAVGVVYVGSTDTRRAKTTSYNDNTSAIEFDTVGTYTLDGDQFSGNTYDVLNSDDAATITAGSFVVGRGYKILTVGTTDFTLIGSADNVIGTKFVATGVGTGTGTATEVLVINKTNGANPTTANNTGTNADTLFVGSVPVTVTVLNDVTGLPITTDARVHIVLSSDKSIILSAATNGSGIASTTYGGAVPVTIEGWVREFSLTGTDFVPKDIGGSITSTGFNLTVRLIPI